MLSRHRISNNISCDTDWSLGIPPSSSACACVRDLCSPAARESKGLGSRWIHHGVNGKKPGAADQSRVAIWIIVRLPRTNRRRRRLFLSGIRTMMNASNRRIYDRLWCNVEWFVARAVTAELDLRLRESRPEFIQRSQPWILKFVWWKYDKYHILYLIPYLC